jgi:hypothetical protein
VLPYVESLPSASSDSTTTQTSTAKQPGGRPDDAQPAEPAERQWDEHAYVESIPADEIVEDPAAGVGWVRDPNTGSWISYSLEPTGDSDSRPADPEASGPGDAPASDDSVSSDQHSSKDATTSSDDNKTSDDDTNASKDETSSTDDTTQPTDDNGTQCTGTCGGSGGEMGNPDDPDSPGDEGAVPWAGKIATTPADPEQAAQQVDSGPQVDENVVTVPLGTGADPEQAVQPQVVTPDPGGEGFTLNYFAIQGGTFSAGSTVTDGWTDAPSTMAQTVAAPRMNVGTISLTSYLVR